MVFVQRVVDKGHDKVVERNKGQERTVDGRRFHTQSNQKDAQLCHLSQELSLQTTQSLRNQDWRLT